jgi:hypothetical protein
MTHPFIVNKFLDADELAVFQFDRLEWATLRLSDVDQLQRRWSRDILRFDW